MARLRARGRGRANTTKYDDSQEEVYDRSALITYLQYFSMKLLTMQAAIPHFFLLLFLIITLEAFEPSGAFNTLPYSVAKSVFLDTDDLQEIRVVGDVYSWLHKVVDNVDGQRIRTHRDGCCRLPILGLVLRQFRTVAKRCPTSSLRRSLDKLQNRSTVELCRPEFSKSDADTRPYTPLFNATFTPAALPGFPNLTVGSDGWGGNDFYLGLDGHTVTGLIGTYARGLHNSLVLMPFIGNQTSPDNSANFGNNNTNLTSFFPPTVAPFLQDNFIGNETVNHLIVDELEAGKWIDKDTSAIVVDLINFHLAADVFIHNAVLIEIDSAGLIRTSVFGTSIRVRSFKLGRDIARFALDVVLSFFALFALVEYVYHVAVRRELYGNWTEALIGPQLANFAAIGVLWALLGVRFWLWHASLTGFPAPNALLEYQELLNIVEGEALLRTMSGWAVCLCLFRFIFFFRYNPRFSLVSETLVSATHDFLGIGSLVVLVLFAYSITGHVLWYHADTNFKTLGGSFMMLFNVMISLEIDQYETYFKHNPYSTALFFVSFFVVAWCVLLNTAVGILATSFAAALETQTFIRRPDWAIDALIRDLIGASKRWIADAAAYAKGIRDPSVIAPLLHGKNRLYRMFSPFSRHALLHSVHVVVALREATEFDDQATVTGSELQLISGFSSDKVAAIGQKSIMHVGLHDAKERQWKMLQASVESGRDITTQLNVQFKRLQELHERIYGYAAHVGADGAAVAADVDAEESTSSFGDDALAHDRSSEIDHCNRDEDAEERAAQEAKKRQQDLLESIRSDAQQLLHRIRHVVDVSEGRRQRLRGAGERLERLVSQLEGILDDVQYR